MSRTLLLVFPFVIASALAAGAGGDAAPSSHMVSGGGFEGDILINEVRVPKDGEALYTYYEALGWGGKAGGYAGIQAHPRARNYIFSIWDHKEHTAPIAAVFRGPGTLTENFGGEGTGLKSWNFELGWETDVWYTLVTRCWPVGDHTYYGYWVRSEKSGTWTHMVTMDVAAEGAFLHGGNDAFLEDWLDTGKNARTSHLRGCWKRDLKGQWHAFGEVTYSVNAWDLTEGKRSFNFRTNWNGGVAKDAGGEYYFMTAGGSGTKPEVANPSKHAIARTGEAPGYPALAILSARIHDTKEGVLKATWEPDPKTAPQFRYLLTAHRDPDGKDEPIAAVEGIDPGARSAELPLPEGVEPRGLVFRLRCEDIFGNAITAVPSREERG